MLRLCVALVCLLAGCAGRAVPKSAPSTLSEEPRKFPVSSPGAAVSASSIERIYVLAPVAGAPTLGPSDAKARLELCSSFGCEACSALTGIVQALSENYGELLQIAYRNCPLQGDAHALSAAEVGREVLRQRENGGFWRYHDRLATAGVVLAPDALVALAGEIEGVDVAQVRAALVDRRHAQTIEREVAQVAEAGVPLARGVLPAVFVNGRLLAPSRRYEDFEDAVERALQELPEDRARALEASAIEYPMARVRHLLVQYRGALRAEPRIARTQAEARALASRLRARIVSGQVSFPELARTESDCPSGRSGGELGRYTRGDLEPRLDVALFTLQAGEVSEVIESPFGYHLLYRED